MGTTWDGQDAAGSRRANALSLGFPFPGHTAFTPGQGGNQVPGTAQTLSYPKQKETVSSDRAIGQWSGLTTVSERPKLEVAQKVCLCTGQRRKVRDLVYLRGGGQPFQISSLECPEVHGSEPGYLRGHRMSLPSSWRVNFPQWR